MCVSEFLFVSRTSTVWVIDKGRDKPLGPDQLCESIKTFWEFFYLDSEFKLKIDLSTLTLSDRLMDAAYGNLGENHTLMYYFVFSPLWAWLPFSNSVSSAYTKGFGETVIQKHLCRSHEQSKCKRIKIGPIASCTV